ncbi:hypothetical protein PC129_g24079 [Phytophthora cactorum]|uniref:Uncharacterized protein n=1 Tax=Phytophthora cactorum TaxID=29920 RepID=A0A8T1GT99_9STRA|nr:hypothetical protein PC111_g20240 [Phytophthora cactorum]KAG3095832.1 hypothetical protein PC122_g5194 [Phytophthora cactorum]KAG3199553.1 hypothetical protein PC129_g24079 [Phytophthora cactorum]
MLSTISYSAVPATLGLVQRYEQMSPQDQTDPSKATSPNNARSNSSYKPLTSLTHQILCYTRQCCFLHLSYSFRNVATINC